MSRVGYRRRRPVEVALIVLVLGALAGCANPTPPAADSGSGPAGSSPAGPAPLVSPADPAPLGPRDGGPGSVGPAGPSGTGSTSPDWSRFPVTVKPRPIVLVGPDVDGPASGFPDGDSKLAFINGQVRATVSLPSAPAGGMAGYPVESATAAATRLTGGPRDGVQTSRELSVVAAQLVTHPFATDRGRVGLPAWQLRLEGISDAVFVLAVTPTVRFPAVVQEGMASGGDVLLGADGRSITVRFTARHVSTSPCDVGFTSTMTVAEHQTAVTLAIKIANDPPAPGAEAVSCPAIGIAPPVGPPAAGAPDTRTIRLAAPLGERVVVDGDGRPFVVTSA